MWSSPERGLFMIRLAGLEPGVSRFWRHLVCVFATVLLKGGTKRHYCAAAAAAAPGLQAAGNRPLPVTGTGSFGPGSSSRRGPPVRGPGLCAGHRDSHAAAAFGRSCRFMIAALCRGRRRPGRRRSIQVALATPGNFKLPRRIRIMSPEHSGGRVRLRLSLSGCHGRRCGRRTTVLPLDLNWPGRG